MNGTTKIHSRRLRWLALALLLVAPGCGKKTIKVEGTVLLDDKPLDGATVVFQPEGGGQPATGVTGSDGVFHLTTRTTGDGARPGEYKVTITKQKAVDVGAVPTDTGGEDAVKAVWKKFIAKPAAGSSKEPSSVPAQYSDPDKTPLKCRVPPEGRVEFKLRSKGES